MAELIFGDVPLNVVVDDLTKLLDEDIERVNKWIRIKRVFLIALVAFSIIRDIFHDVLLVLSCCYLFTLGILAYKANGGYLYKISYCVAILRMFQLEENSLNEKLSLVRFMLVHYGNVMILEFPKEERVDVLVKVSRTHYWLKQAFQFVPQFSQQ